MTEGTFNALYQMFGSVNPVEVKGAVTAFRLPADEQDPLKLRLVVGIHKPSSGLSRPEEALNNFKWAANNAPLPINDLQTNIKSVETLDMKFNRDFCWMEVHVGFHRPDDNETSIIQQIGYIVCLSIEALRLFEK